MGVRGNRFRRPAGQRPLVLGHRGARHARPENTLSAFELALEEGADGVELDLRLCADGEPIVFHDRGLERMTRGRDTRRVESVTLDELERVDVGDGQHPPRLCEVLDWAERRGARVNVELKHDGERTRELVDRVIDALRRMRQGAELVLLSCFHPGVVWRLARELPDLPVSWLVHRKQRLFKHAPGWKLLGAAGVNPERVIATERAVKRWRRGGALISVWTVNDPLEAQRLAALGVDALISDVPGRLVSALS